MHCKSRAVITANGPRMIPYMFWGKSAPIVPRLRPRRDLPINGLSRTSSKSISQIRLFIAGDESAWH